MSFFYDFLKYFNISDLDGKIAVTSLIGYGVMVVGNLKLTEITDEYIFLSSKKEKLKIFGENLKIISIAKGEIVVSGNVKKIETGDVCKG